MCIRQEKTLKTNRLKGRNLFQKQFKFKVKLKTLKIRQEINSTVKK